MHKHLDAIAAGVAGIRALLDQGHATATPAPKTEQPPAPIPVPPPAPVKPDPAPVPAPAPAPTPAPAPPVVKKPYLDPPAKLVVPHEEDVPAFYGPASEEAPYLEWFQFPTDDIRLYTRHGDQLKDRDGDKRDEHRCHRQIRDLLENALLCIYHTLGADRYHAEGWHVYSGCFNYRKRKLGGSLSMHAYGIAVDFNDSENPLYSKTTSFSPESVDIMEKYGFLWGPRAWGMPGYDADELGKYVDPMHFQLAIPFLDAKSWYAVRGLPSNIVRWRPGPTQG